MITMARLWRGDPHPAQCLWNPQEALAYFVQFELGFGGIVVALDESNVGVEVQALMGTSTTTFSGPPAEMSALVRVAGQYVALRAEHGQRLVEQAASALDTAHLRKPLFVALAFNHLGQGTAKLAVMLAFGVSDEADIASGLRTTFPDLCAAVHLFGEGVSLRELLDTPA